MPVASADWRACAFALGIVFAHAAHAQTFTPAPNATHVLDLDTQAGAFSQWRAGDLDGANAARGRVTFLRKGSDRRWPPVFNIAVGDDQVQAWLQVTALPHSGPLIVRTFRREGQTETDIEYFSLTPNFREPFDLKIDWSPDGRVAFTIASQASAGGGVDVAPLQGGGARNSRTATTEVRGERHEVSLGRPPVWLLVNNSTGEVMIDPSQLGWAQP
jgi:hypothetical protein